MKAETVTEENLPEFCRKLAGKDKNLDFVFRTYGTPPLWLREPTFATLIHIILEQQVSVASALSAFNKLKENIGEVTPKNILKLNDAEIKACYFSRQKTNYARNLAGAIICKELILDNLYKQSDDEVRNELIKIKGIGRWTADIYLLMAMKRPDVMPKGDLALHVAFQKLANLEKRPKSDEFIKIAEKWKPFRSVAARLLWHFYLCERKNIN
ncbi:MAG: DNA-3-methyladenine glycosylase 2 family protein [Acidobacteriota bacterium]|nr:DNA-3-methyladenine glycosylase 2 family protein [Acidobacteriota bacterium]